MANGVILATYQGQPGYALGLYGLSFFEMVFPPYSLGQRGHSRHVGDKRYPPRLKGCHGNR